GYRFTTYEAIEHEGFMVTKRDGVSEEFSRDKLVSGIKKACQKRPVSQIQIQEMADCILTEINNKYDKEVPSMAIGERVMESLRQVDQVAYVRFASVYRRFQEVTEFVQEIKKLEEKP
ncbi:MAG: transcriptional regulator NrdR, partial [Verrucomicrobia bacterium]|nr:transcriptional regulator NrdR [Verrucomicrobiota bacterium]